MVQLRERSGRFLNSNWRSASGGIWPAATLMATSRRNAVAASRAIDDAHSAAAKLCFEAGGSISCRRCAAATCLTDGSHGDDEAAARSEFNSHEWGRALRSAPSVRQRRFLDFSNAWRTRVRLTPRRPLRCKIAACRIDRLRIVQTAGERCRPTAQSRSAPVCGDAQRFGCFLQRQPRRLQLHYSRDSGSMRLTRRGLIEL